MGYSIDLSGYRSRYSGYGYRPQQQLLLPASIDQLLASSRPVEHLLKEIYGLEAEAVATIAVRRLCSGVQGNLSDSARIQLDIELTDGGERRYNWFVKIRPRRCKGGNPLEGGGANTSDFNVFKNEIEFYEKIVPEMREFLATEGCCSVGDNNNGDLHIDIPTMLYAREEEVDEDGYGGGAIIVLDDVIAQGYRHERDEHGGKYLSTDLAAAALESIALIHAVSVSMQLKRQVALAEVHPTLVESGLVWAQADMAVRLGHMRDTYCHLLGQSRELDSPTLLTRFRQTFDSEERLREMCAERCRPKEDKMTSLQHGDFHFNNLLFKRDGEGASRPRVMIVDWQLAYSGRSTGDLSYLLMSSLSHESREKHEEEMKSVYYSTFNSALARLVNRRCEEEVLEVEYHHSLPLSFFLSCGNIMAAEMEEESVKFSYEICKEAVEKDII